MKIKQQLEKRSNNTCELCSITEQLEMYIVPPGTEASVDNGILICTNCLQQMEGEKKHDYNHWRCLNDSMWSEVPAVQVVIWRLLHKLKDESWPANLLEMMYLDEESHKWAESGLEVYKVIHKDSNGVVLATGDTVVLIKDLKVKGANFTAKRGTSVRRITLVHDNPEHIEGKINGQRIVILTEFVKKLK